MIYVRLVPVLLLAFLLAGCGSESKETAATPDTQAAPETASEPPGDAPRDALAATPDFIAGASELVAEFSGTTLDTINAKYGGKVVEVAGALCYIDQVVFSDGVTKGPVYVNLCESGTYQRLNVRCQFPEDDTTYVFGGVPDRLLIVNGTDTLARGHEVVIRGYYETLGARDFRMEDCQIVEY